MRTSGFELKPKAGRASGLTGNSVAMSMTLPLLLQVGHTIFSFEFRAPHGRCGLAFPARASHDCGAEQARRKQEVNIDRNDDASGIRAANHCHPERYADVMRGEWTAPGSLCPVDGVEVQQTGGNAPDRAGVVHEAFFADGRSDDPEAVIFVCYAEVRREYVAVTLLDASNRRDGATQARFCSTTTPVEHAASNPKVAAAKALFAIGVGLLIFAALAQIAC
jgi:hypothetical protein